MLPEHYLSTVLKAYLDKRDAHSLSLNLLHPTRKSLKAECMVVLNERYMPKDEMVLKAVFGAKENLTGYMNAIRIHDVDKFRPLLNFLKGESTYTDTKNVELLAWLINYEPRPYHFDPAKSYDVKDAMTGKEDSPINTRDFGRIETENFIKVVEIIKPKRKSLVKYLTLSTLIIIGVTVIVYLYSRRSLVKEQCMSWTGVEYVKVSCNVKTDNVLVVAADETRITSLKKITRADTLTAASIGHVWYSKINGKLEFFTAGGLHPIYLDRRLKPITRYILNAYPNKSRL